MRPCRAAHREPSRRGRPSLPCGHPPGSIEFHRPPPFPAAFIDDFHFVDLRTRRDFSLQIFRSLLGGNPGGEPTRNAFPWTRIEGRVDRDLDLAGGCGASNSIHLDGVEFEYLLFLRTHRTLLTVSRCAMSGHCFGRAEKGNTILSNLVFGRLQLVFLFCFRLDRALVRRGDLLVWFCLLSL